MRRLTPLLLIISALGCLTVKAPEQSDPAVACVTPKATPTPSPVVLAWEPCKGYHACFTDKEFKALVDKLTQLESER